MKAIKDKGAIIAAAVAIAISLTSWLRADGGRSQQLADLTAQVQQLEGQVQHIQNELDEYLLHHDGH